MTRTAYVSGKIAGLPIGEVRLKFNTISNELTDKGYNVVKPLAVTDDYNPWDDTARNNIKQMLESDEVHLLPDWQESRYAQLERDIALRLGIEVVYH